MNDVPDSRVIAEAEHQALPTASRGTRLQRLRWPLIIAAPVIVLAALAYYYLTGGRYVATDDAYVGAARVAVSPSVSGRIIAIDVHENEFVNKGDVLIEFDDSDFVAAVQHAEAALAAAHLQVAALRATYEQASVDLSNAVDAAAYAEREKTRQHNLLTAGVTSQQTYDKAAHAADEAQHAVNAAKQHLAKAIADLGGDPKIDIENHPMVLQAKATLQRAKIDLADTKVLAAESGVVTKVEQVQVGSYATASQPLFWLVSRSRWIEANFKENQLAHLKPGQSAVVTLDAFPGRKIEARVASFSPGTGSSFSLLPPENATGNWVKVAQRLPVRLDIVKAPDDVFLASGLSAHVRIDTHSSAAPSQSESAP